MNTHKQEIDGIIDRLADKTLSFGQRIEFKGELYLYTRDTGDSGSYYSLVELVKVSDDSRLNVPYLEGFGEGKVKWKPNNDFKILGHPILKCHVEQKMLHKGVLYDESEHLGLMKFNSDVLTYLWQPFGFPKSLQEIAEMVEYENGIAKPSPATDLFLLLKNLTP